MIKKKNSQISEFNTRENKCSLEWTLVDAP